MRCFIYLHTLLVFSYHASFSMALEMEGVMLQGGKEYLRIQDDQDAVLDCKYTLKDGETTSVVTWYHDDLMAFVWGLNDSPEVGEGLKEGDAVLTRSDGNLEFTGVKSGLEGKYRCEVTTSAGETYKSFEYQLLVVDMPVVPDMAKHKVDGCKIMFSWMAPAIKPKPDISCGVYSTTHGYILKATKWMATPYYNGSISYSLEEETFDIFHMPLDALIRCEVKITKVDDSEVMLISKEYNFTEVWERGCAPLEVGDGVDLDYDNERVTCHAEVRPKDESAPAIAHVKCKDGYTPKYGDFVSSVDLICKETKWDIGGGLTWNHFDNLLCEPMPKLPEQPPVTRKDRPSQMSSSPETSGVNGLITPTALIVLLGVTLLSFAVWSIKSHPKKKDPRFMA